jgi:hypothetical protein
MSAMLKRLVRQASFTMSRGKMGDSMESRPAGQGFAERALDTVSILA